MKNKIIALVLVCILVFSLSTVSFAAEIKSVTADGNTLNVEINAEDVVKENIKASVDGQPLTVESVENNAGSTEWIIVCDTSISVSNEHFAAEKKAIISLYDSLGENDSLSVYTFDVGSQKVADNSAAKEDFAKKVNAIKCTGQDTELYDVICKMIDTAKESKADSCKIVIYSDGKDTLSKTSKDDTTAKMKESGIPVYGLYSSKLDKESATAFNNLVKVSGGKASSFTTDSASKALTGIGSSNSYALTLKSENVIPANDAAVLSIDLGDGNAITYETKIEAQEVTEETASEETESAAETETEPAEEESSLPIPLPAIIAVIVILIAAVAVVIILRKKSSGKEKKEKETDDNTNDFTIVSKEDKKSKKAEKEESTENKKPKKPAKQKDESQEFQFYFENKKK